MIQKRQREYYDVLATADNAADSTAFVEFMLYTLKDSLKEFLLTEQVREQVTVPDKPNSNKQKYRLAQHP